jgi:hypothetical protein
MNRLDFNKQLRKIGSNQTYREYYDFIIDGTSLKSLLNISDVDLISPFGWGPKELENESIAEFKLKKISDLSSGRIIIYICPECGDISCGAITVRIIKDDNKIIWTDFASENGETEYQFGFKVIKDFEFNKDEYYQVFDKIK